MAIGKLLQQDWEHRQTHLGHVLPVKQHSNIEQSLLYSPPTPMQQEQLPLVPE